MGASPRSMPTRRRRLPVAPTRRRRLLRLRSCSEEAPQREQPGVSITTSHVGFRTAQQPDGGLEETEGQGEEAPQRAHAWRFPHHHSHLKPAHKAKKVARHVHKAKKVARHAHKAKKVAKVVKRAAKKHH